MTLYTYKALFFADQAVDGRLFSDMESKNSLRSR